MPNFGALTEQQYKDFTNSPSGNPSYYTRFHLPLIEHARGRTERVSLVDIACGFAHELDFFPREGLEITGIDVSDVVLKQARKRLPHVHFIEHDVREIRLPYKPGSKDIGIAVNAMIYVPGNMLHMLYRSLKPDGEAVVNLRDANNSSNQLFFNYVLSEGATLREITITVEGERFHVFAIDYAGYRVEEVRGLGMQTYFKGQEDIEKLIQVKGFHIVGHEKFQYPSVANPNNEMDVFTLQKPAS